MQAVARVLPPSYVFQGMRTLLAGQTLPPGDLLFGAALAALDIVLAGYFFTRVFRYALRTGLLARYSAESVS
jgi:ABC-2 type transport system permease protein